MKNEIMDQKKQIRNILFLFTIMAFTTNIFLRDYSISELYETLKGIHPLYLITGFSLLLVFVSCEALNIKMILKVLGQEVTYKKSLSYSLIGFYFSAITPSSSGGQPAQVYYMKKDDITISNSAITLFFILFVYQIAMVLLGGVMSILNPEVTYGFAIRLPLLLLYGIIMNVGAIFIISALMFSKKIVPKFINYILHIGSKLRLVKEIDAVQIQIAKGLNDYHEKSKLIKKHSILFYKVLSITIIQMISLNMVSYIIYLGMGYREYSILKLITSQSLLTISVSAVPLPGSIGAAEGGFLQAYTYFLTQDALKSFMILTRSISFYFPLIISFILYITIHFHHKKLR